MPLIETPQSHPIARGDGDAVVAIGEAHEKVLGR